MHTAGNVPFRALAARATIILFGLSVACDREPSAPDSLAVLTPPAVQRVARERVIEPGDGIPNPPAVDAWLQTGLANALNMAFDPNTERFLRFEPSTSQLIEMAAGSSGDNRLTTRPFDARSFGIRDPQGLTVDPGSGRLFVLDAGSRIVRVDPHPELGFHQPLISVIDLAPAGLSGARGIAFDPVGGHLHVLHPAGHALHQISLRGEILATWDMTPFGVSDPRAMTFGPTGDATDEPSAVGLYVASGSRITELQLIEAAAVPAPSGTATLVRTTQTSQFSPPSPDPSGIAYATHLGRLVIGDGEVNEMPLYAGWNIFETTLSGSLSGGWTTTAFSGEPTGTAYNPANRHLFISDDDKTQIFEVDPGADGLYGTSDDQRTSFDTAIFGCTDPEGVAYDPAQGALFIADGVNAQVWRVSPGANGIFDGVAPAGDDQVTSFDTQVHGLLDPEGIAYDPDFGNVYVVGKPATLVFHFTPTGGLLRAIDISAAQAYKPAGLDYAPGSTNPGTFALYIVDRGVDNNDDSRENDGKMYEVSLPSFSGNNLPSVTITAPPNGSTFTQSSSITFTGTASDTEDGNLSASLAWTSSLDGALGSGASVSTSALSLGTHTITASVTDSRGGHGSAAIAVTVNSPGSGNVVQVRVTVGTDDAEESATGSMYLTSSDLELVNDGNDQTVGLRFTGLTIPPGATITGAYVQFQVDETPSAAASLTITGQATDNAPTFAGTARNISSRSRTASAVSWSPAAWPTVGQAGPAQQTPSLTSIIQEIVNRSGWRSGNAIALIITGTGRRVAEAFEGVPSAAPLLRVEYSTGPNAAPTASNVTISGTAQVGQVLTGNYTYSDAEGDVEGTSTYRWLRDGTPISGATARNYTLGAADQGALIGFEVTPVAATGTAAGAPSVSAPVGPVATAPPNSPPTVSNAVVTGTTQVGQVLTGNYSYSDADGDVEGTSTYQWFRDGTPIGGATARSYTLGATDQGAMIVFEVTPVAATGTSPGAPAQSPAVGPVVATPPSGMIQVRIAVGSDDAEESATGSMYRTSTDLELVNDGNDQTVGLRFTGLTIPPGATITGAYVQFQVDETPSAAASLTITGQAADNAPTFGSTTRNISSRARTASAVSWSPAAWPTVGQAGPAQQTPSLTSIIQEIVNRSGWTSGNAIALIITGTGRRVAEAFEGAPSAAPLLHVEYSTGPNAP